VGPALLFRAIATAEAVCAIAEQTEREVNALALLRTLCEDVIVFAWLAADPSGRTPRWQCTSLKQELKVDDDFRAQTGSPLLTPEEREARERELASLSASEMPPVATCAQEADQHWDHVSRWRIEFEGMPPGTFAALYAQVFRTASIAVHTTPQSLNRLVEEAGDTFVVQREPTLGEQSAYPLLVALTGRMLRLAAFELGYPSLDEWGQVLAEQAGRAP
jgi:hypothetical protein